MARADYCYEITVGVSGTILVTHLGVGQAVMAEAGKTAPRDRSATQRTYELLRERILSGAINPGETLSQVSLARDLGVSRTPLREALPMLQREGLVEAETSRRIRVTSLSTDYIEELFALRIVNEALAIYLSVPHMTPRDGALLARSLGELDRAADAGEVVQWDEHHHSFHRELVKHGGARSKRFLWELGDQTERRRFAGWQDAEVSELAASGVEHREIVDACLAQDPRAASKLLARHIGREAIAMLTAHAPDHAPVRIRAAHEFVGVEWPGIPERVEL